MSAAPRTRPVLFHRLISLLIVSAGIVTSVVSYWSGRQQEIERAEMEFARRASQRHALTREIFARYEDSLFGLSSLFVTDGVVTRNDFVRATSRLEQRITGAQAFEWVPFVPHEDRATVEGRLQRAYRDQIFEFVQYNAQGQRERAKERRYYYPIAYIQPMSGNEAALGYDIATGPTAPYLERARESRHPTVTSQIRLVQERSNELGIVMIWPVYRPPRPPNQGGPSISGVSDANASSPAPEVFAGFLQCVFRIKDFLETMRSPQASSILDMLFVDDTEPDPAKRVLYYRPAADAAPGSTTPSEAEFRQPEISRDFPIPFGQRMWRVVYRPRAGWLETQRSNVPFLRSCSFILLAGLLAGLVELSGRQAGTIQRQVEERTAELAENRRQFSTLLDALPGLAFRCAYDEPLRVLFVSEGTRALTGWSPEDFVAGHVHFRDLIHPDDLARVREVTRLAVQERRSMEVECRIRTRDGEEKWVLSRGRATFGDKQLPIVEGLVIDITAQKKSEQAGLELERKLLEGQKLESLGLLAGGIAHDFNNLLSAILGNAGLARLNLPPGIGIDEQLAAIESASQRAAELCRQMLAYAGKGRFVVEPADLSTLTQDLLPLLRISIVRQAVVDLQLAPGLPAVMADATQIRQIVMNLVLNGSDAIASAPQPNYGTITVKTGLARVDTTTLASCVTGSNLPAGDYVFLEVRDTGGGMTSDVKAKIFDPFFTTKFAGRGLGLAAVLGIVRSHSGALLVETVPGQGSMFRLLLPPVKGMATDKAQETKTDKPRKYSGYVLVVDDEESVRHVTVAMLRSLGFTVRSAVDGQDGLTAFRENAAGFDLVILDMLMPRLNGEQTLTAMRQIRPDVRVLLMSGYSDGDLLRRLAGQGRLAFLSKPFGREIFEEKVRELLS
jgi:two-component system cell cycle sensor histidine kinase/response regulator CckA